MARSCCSLLPAPSALPARVLEDDALHEQLGADAIGCRVILALARRFARRDGFGDPALRFPALKEGLRLALQQAEHAAERPQLCRERLLARVDAVREIEQH